MIQFLPFRDWTIAYERMGKGPSLLFLHNGGTSHHIWLPAMERLQDSFDVTAIDLLGYGDSSKPGDHYDMDTYVDMVIAVLDKLNIEKVTLVGNCMGAAISAHLIQRVPERILGAVLVNPLTEATFSAGWLGLVLKARQLAPGIVGPIYKQLGRIRLPKWTAPMTLAFQMGARGRGAGLQKHAELGRHHASAGQLHSMLSVLADIDNYAAVDHIQRTAKSSAVPVATFWGGSNLVLSAKKGEQLNAQLQSVQCGVLPDCGHLVMLEAPDEIADFIRKFHAEHL